MNQVDLKQALADLHQRGHRTVTAKQVADELWPTARQNNTRGQTFNLAAGIAGRMLARCKAVARTGKRTWTIVPEYLKTPTP